MCHLQNFRINEVLRDYISNNKLLFIIYLYVYEMIFNFRLRILVSKKQCWCVICSIHFRIQNL